MVQAHTTQLHRSQEMDDLLAAYRLYLRHRAPAPSPLPTARCCVCNYALDPSPMQCAACGCRVHPHCYGYVKKPPSPWLCCVCEDIATGLLNRPPGDFSSDAMASIMPLRRRVRCCLCGIATGALAATPLPGVYAHVCCGVWLKECTLSNHTASHRSAFDAFFLSPRHCPLVVNPTHLLSSSTHKHEAGTCQFCGRSGGVVQCQRRGCERCFHVMCGYAHGVQMSFQVSAVLRREVRDCILFSTHHTYLCTHHSADLAFAAATFIEERTGEEAIGEGLAGEGLTGDKQTGEGLTGDKPTDERPTGERPTGDKPTGNKPTGNKPADEEHSGDKHSGDKHSGDGPWQDEEKEPLDMAAAGLCDLTCFPAATVLAHMPFLAKKERTQIEKATPSQPSSHPFAALLARCSAAGMWHSFDDLVELPASLLVVKVTSPAVMIHTRPHKGRRRKVPSLVDDIPVLDARQFGSAPCEMGGRMPVTAASRCPKIDETPVEEHAGKTAAKPTKEHVTKSTEEHAVETARKPTKEHVTKSETKPVEVKKHRPPKRNSPSNETPTFPFKKQLYKSIILYCPDGVQKLPPSPLNSLSSRQNNRSPAVLLSNFLKSALFEELFSTGAVADSETTSPSAYMMHYFCGVSKEVLAACLKGNLDIGTVIASGDQSTEGLEEVLQCVAKCSGFAEKVCVLRLLLLSALCSVYPPHVVATASARRGGMIARSAMVEVRHLSEVCQLLGELAVQLSSVVRCLNDPKDYEKDRARAGFAPQCLCLEENVEDALVCASCRVQYHSECLGLQKTAYADLVQTKMCGYWSLERGFVCPRCCSGDLFEMSRVVKGEVQVRDSVLMAWQTHEKRKRK